MVLLSDAPERLDRFLTRSLPGHSRSRLAEHILSGAVTVGGVVRTKSSHHLEPGQEVVLDLPEDRTAPDLAPADIPLSVVFEDDHLLVIDKPRGLPTHPAPTLHEPTLVNALLGRGVALSEGAAPFRPGIVHRLDKETTGLIVVAKTDAAHADLAAQIAAKTADRRYLTVVARTPDWTERRISGPIGRDPKDRLRMAVVPDGKASVTRIRVIRSSEEGALLACRLETGRTHQIRVHLAALGHPVIGDEIYGTGPGPMMLHAGRLAFRHPATGEEMVHRVAPPPDFGFLATAEDLDEG